MSTIENDLLLGRAGELVDLAARYMEEFTATTVEGIIERQVANMTEDIDSDNLDDLFNISMPALERTLNDCAQVLAQESVDHFNTEVSDVY